MIPKVDSKFRHDCSGRHGSGRLVVTLLIALSCALLLSGCATGPAIVTGPTRDLAVGQSVTIRVKARNQRTDTGIMLHTTEQYSLAVDPKRNAWIDLWHRTDEHGFESERLNGFERKKRLSGAKWFALLGQVDVGAPFEISKWDGIPRARGELGLFPNDVHKIVREPQRLMACVNPTPVSVIIHFGPARRTSTLPRFR